MTQIDFHIVLLGRRGCIAVFESDIRDITRRTDFSRGENLLGERISIEVIYRSIISIAILCTDCIFIAVLRISACRYDSTGKN
jgi:hypothetical protein